RPRHPRSGC
ncbi:hypothetical protein BN1708_019157, partial [Verticillium longisporum]